MGSGDYIISERTSNAILDCSDKVTELEPKELREAFQKYLPPNV